MNNEKAIRLALYETKGVGPVSYWKLLKYFQNAGAVWEAKEDDLCNVVSAKIASKIVLARNEINLRKVMDRYEFGNINLLFAGLDENYPSALSALAVPPPIVFYKGRLLLEDNWAIAVVGTRTPTTYGKEVTRKLVGELVEGDLAIISGLALGIDAVAHETALQFGGRTIAVLGSGLDEITPVQNSGLAQRIIDSGQGAVVSTFPLGSEVQRGNFVIRNQYVAGLALGVLVVEGAAQSGTIITAEYAVKQQKPVFAVPGPITSSLSAAPVELIKRGACLITNGEEILKYIGRYNEKLVKKSNELPQIENELQLNIWKILEKEEKEIDELSRELNLPMSQLATTITQMEIEGWISRQGAKIRIVAR